MEWKECKRATQKKKRVLALALTCSLTCSKKWLPHILYFLTPTYPPVICVEMSLLYNILTQHALALPSEVIPGLDAILDLSRNIIRVHVLDRAVHA